MFIVIYGMLEGIGCAHGHTANVHDVRAFETRADALADIIRYCRIVTASVNGALGTRHYSCGHKYADLMERELGGQSFDPIDEGDCSIDSCNIKSVLP